MAKKINITINFDLDGTLADLYGVPNWLPMLRSEDETPYVVAKPLLQLNLLARRLNKLQKAGYKLGVISWLSMDASDTYNEKVIAAKRLWLKVHMPSVHWDNMVLVPYGTPKENYGSANDILFDDDEKNRTAWKGTAYDVDNILGILAKL